MQAQKKRRKSVKKVLNFVKKSPKKGTKNQILVKKAPLEQVQFS